MSKNKIKKSIIIDWINKTIADKEKEMEDPYIKDRSFRKREIQIDTLERIKYKLL